MLTEVKKEIKLMFLSIKYNISKEMVNKMTFLTNIIFMILNNSAFIVQWIIIYGLKSSVGGYSFNDVLLLWGLASGTYSICFIIFGGCEILPNLIVDGKIDTFLVQPKNVLISILTSKTKISAIGDLAYSYILLFIYGFDIKLFILYTIFIITGGIIITSIGTIFGSLAFYITKADSITNNIMGTILSFSTYPEGIFKGAIKILFYTIIPISFVAYLPLNILKHFSLINTSYIIIFTIFISLIAFLVFNTGLKRYSSTNLMQARI